MSSKHDSAQKDFFSHKQIVTDFLLDYVQQAWVRLVDFDSLEKVNSSYVHEADQQRIGDVVWRLKLKDGSGWVYMYLLIELQSEVDRYMALRMMVYVGLFYQDLIKQGNLNPDGLLPPIFPAVIYNGKRPWNAPSNLSELIVQVGEPLSSCSPTMSYFVFDEGRVQPLAPDNILSTIIQMEKAPDAEQLAAALQRASELLSAPEHQPLRRSLLAWLKRVVLHRVEPNQEFSQLHELQEVQTMLAETVTEWTHQWHEEGWQKGLKEGLQKGEQSGEQKGLQKAAAALARRNLSVAEIAQYLELDESEVKRMLD